MKKIACLIILCAATFACQSQNQNSYNLDFEELSKMDQMADDWRIWGDYDIKMDSTISHSGTYSARIFSNIADTTLSGSIYYEIPAKFKGEKIELKGYIKTQDVENGYCGLLFWAQSKNSTPFFESMEDKKVVGSTDWTEYTISVTLPLDAESFFVGGYLTGTGTVWFDDFSLTIDGRDVQSLKTYEESIPKAKMDKEFENGSKVQIQNLNNNVIGNLELLAKVWGFIKYHHPKICMGEFNMDFELFRLLPKYLNVGSTEERDKVLFDWIDGFGEFKKCDSCNGTSSNAFINTDFNWVDSHELDFGLRDKLYAIYNNRCQGEQYYVEMAPGVGNPIFKNEDQYYFAPHPDDGLQLLSLFRYWNIIHYFFPYRKLIENDWNEVLKEYIPKFVNAKSRLEYEMAVLELIGEISDTHAQLLMDGTHVNRVRGRFHAPFAIKYIEEKWVIADFYDEKFKGMTSVGLGDVLTHVENRPVDEIVDSIHKYYPASNEPARMRNISKDILRSNKRELQIRVNRAGSTTSHIISLYERDSLDFRWYNDNLEKSYQLINGNIGYISLNKVLGSDIGEIKTIFNQTTGAIIDIRNYPSGMAAHLWPYFCRPDTPFAKFTKGDINNPGEFGFTKPSNTPKASGKTYGNKPIVVLVNEETQSMAEFTAMAYKTNPNTLVLGSRTAGADGNVSLIGLPYGLQTQISGIGVYYPDGKGTQRIGILPDLVVRPTIKGVMDGSDEVLEKAIELITGK